MDNGVKKLGGRGRRFGFLVLAAIVIGGGYYAWSWNYFYRNAPERVGKDMTFIWQWKMYAGGMKVAYAKDTYGGATPEETLQLFVDALKKGDIELAAKYYIPEKQEEIFHNLEKGKENGNLEKYIEYLQKGDHGIASTQDEYHILASNENKEIILDIQFALNLISKKWKIVAP
jgi:hypothetical protein